MAVTVCRVEDCDRTVVSRGWCKKHYTRWLRHGDPTKVATPGRKPATGHGSEQFYRQHGCRCDECKHGRSERKRRRADAIKRGLNSQSAWFTADRVTDFLFIDGGWWSTDALLERLQLTSDEALQRVLRRLRDKGLVESRVVELSSSTTTGRRDGSVISITRTYEVGTLERRTEWRHV